MLLLTKLLLLELSLRFFYNYRITDLSVLMKERHSKVVLHIMIKDYQNNISEVHYAADNIRLVLPIQYTSKELEERLHD